MSATVENNSGEQYSPSESVLPTLDSATGPLSFDIVEEEKDFHALEPDWNSIFLQQKNKLSEQCFARALVAWETVGRPKGRKLFIIVGRVRGRVVLIFPLSVQTLGPIRMVGDATDARRVGSARRLPRPGKDGGRSPPY